MCLIPSFIFFFFSSSDHLLSFPPLSSFLHPRKAIRREKKFSFEEHFSEWMSDAASFFATRDSSNYKWREGRRRNVLPRVLRVWHIHPNNDLPNSSVEKRVIHGTNYTIWLNEILLEFSLLLLTFQFAHMFVAPSNVSLRTRGNVLLFNSSLHWNERNKLYPSSIVWSLCSRRVLLRLFIK